MKIHEFRKLIDTIDDNLPEYADQLVTVKVSEPNTFPSTPSSEVTGVMCGIDWDNWQVIIQTKERLYKH